MTGDVGRDPAAPGGREPMTLKLIRGGLPDDPTGSRTRTARRRIAARRTVTGRPPPGRDPVAEILERLDEEPTGEHPRIPQRRWTGRPDRTTAALLLVLCAALAAAGFYGARWYGDRQTERANRQALAAATQACVDFVSVSAASVDRDLQRILAGTTGDFRDEFSRRQSQVRAAVVENDVQSQGTVLRGALLSGDRRRATALVAVDATVRNANAPDGRRSNYRIQVELVRTDGRWLVSRLQFVG
jgi:Mce-associated membrane protein